MLSIAICDNENIELEITSACAREWIRTKQNTWAEVYACTEVSELIERINSGVGFDVYILEINIKDTDGIDLGRLIRKKDADVPIIYVTRSTERALEAYELHAARYILKPIRYAEIMSALDLALLMHGSREKKPFIVKKSGLVTNLDMEDIMYVENDVRNMRYMMKDGSTVNGVRRNISFEEALSPLLKTGSFIQIHKSFIVNMKYIANLKKDSVLMSSGTTLPISRRHINQVHEAFRAFKG